MDKTLEIELTEIRPKVLATALRFFRASRLDGDPEDVVQDVLLRLWVARRDGVQIRSAEAWAVSTTKNSCISLWRKKGPVRSGVYPEWLSDGNDASTLIEQSEAGKMADKALERLPAGTRRLLRLRATGLSLDEIAAITGRTKGGVKSSISAARQELYLDAETTCEQEQELAASFATTPPADEEEMAVYKMMQAVKPIELPELPEAGDEYDRMVRPSRVRPFYTWGLSLAGVAAAIVAVVLFTGRPDVPQPQPAQPDEMADLFQLLSTVSYFDPADADNYEFKPVGDGFVMTAHFPDGQTASYILTPLDGGKSFNLISLNQ